MRTEMIENIFDWAHETLLSEFSGVKMCQDLEDMTGICCL